MNRPLPTLLLTSCIGLLMASLGAPARVLAQTADPAQPAMGGLRSSDASLRLQYQRVDVPGERPLDLMGLHLHHPVMDGIQVGAGFYAPLFKGEYGGFVAADLGVLGRRRLAGPLFLTAGLSAGGGGGGRSVEHSKLLSGTGGFVKGHLGLGYDFGDVSAGVSLSKIKFRKSLIDSSQASVFVELPFRYLTGPYAGHGQSLPPSDEQRAAQEMGESMLTLSLDNYRQQNPQGSNKNTIGLADLQYAHFFARDSYWFASLGMGYRGMPLYNQLLGGVGQRYRVTPALTLFGQLGVGSGGYAPEVIDTASGLLVYPRLGVEYALSRELGLAFTLGHMAAPKGSSRNQTFGLALSRHLGARPSGENAGPARYQGMRVSVFQHTAFQLSYREQRRPALQMMGLQLDLPLDRPLDLPSNPRWYLPLQASGAYNAYLGYPGYAEIFAGLGLQTHAMPGDRFQVFGQVMAGANVHGKAAKLSAGLRYVLDDRLALNASLGRTLARGHTGGHFSANNLMLGLDYRFAIPTR